jgi:hypothetical protein
MKPASITQRLPCAGVFFCRRGFIVVVISAPTLFGWSNLAEKYVILKGKAQCR